MQCLHQAGVCISAQSVVMLPTGLCLAADTDAIRAMLCCVVHLKQCCVVQMDEKVGFHESGMWLPIKIGKLDIPATLAEAANTLKGQSVGVYVAGRIPISWPNA